MTSKLTPDMTIRERVDLIEAALVKVLDRDSSLWVEPACGNDDAHVCTVDPDGTHYPGKSPETRRHNLYRIARDLEAML